MDKSIVDYLSESDIEKAIEIRATEETLLEFYGRGRIRGTIHTCVGSEISAVLIGKHLDHQKDWLFTNHRGHGHFLSFNGSPDDLIREIFGKYNGPSKGVGGSQHIKKGNFFSSGIQGSQIPVAVGVAKSLKESEIQGICVVFFGDGTLGTGSLWESLNLAAVINVPIVFVCEDNQIAQSTPSSITFAGDLETRVSGFGVDYLSVDTRIPNDKFDLIRIKLSETREQKKPLFLHLRTERINAHSKGDDNRDINLLKEIKNDYLKSKIQSQEWAEFYQTKKEQILNLAEKISTEPESDFLPIEIEFKKNYGKKKINIELDNGITRLRIFNSLTKQFMCNKDLLMIGEDIEWMPAGTTKPYGGAFKVTGSLSRDFPGRVINSPISENSIIGLAIGRSLTGKNTIVEIMFGDFLSLGFDQLLNNASKFTWMYGESLKLPLIIRTPMGGGFGYGPTHSQSIEKYFCGIPNLIVFALNPFMNFDNLFNELFRIGLPIILLENKRDYLIDASQLVKGDFKVKACDLKLPRHVEIIRKNWKESEKIELTIITYGGMTSTCHKAQQVLNDEYGIMCNLVSVCFLSPIDISDFYPVIAHQVLIVEEASGKFGFTSELYSQLVKLKPELKIDYIFGSGMFGITQKSESEAVPDLHKIVLRVIQFVKLNNQND